MRGADVEYESAATYEYECLSCGDLVAAESHPGDCPTCGTGYRNRRMPIE